LRVDHQAIAKTKASKPYAARNVLWRSGEMPRLTYVELLRLLTTAARSRRAWRAKKPRIRLLNMSEE
jgi:hypothetical protein